MSDAVPHRAPDQVSSTVGETWERLDTPAAVPRSAGASRQRAGAASDGRPLRLRRSRGHVLAALDAGGSVLQRHGRNLLVGSSVLLLPVVALNLWATSQVFDRTGATTLTAFGGDDVGTGIEDVAAMLAVVCASLAATVVGCFAAIVLLADRFGAPVALRPALRGTMQRLPTVLVAWAIGHIWVPFVSLWSLSSTTDDLGGRLVLAGLVGLFFTTSTLLVVPVVAGEGLGPIAALRRSWRLARLRTGSAVGFVCVSGGVGALLLVGITSLPALAEVSGFVTFGSSLWLAQGVASQLGVIVVVPLIALATAQMYLLIRVDAEGLDIVIDADAAFGPASSTERST